MTEAQASAGFTAMRGIFKTEDVMRALQRAGVATEELDGAAQDLLSYLASSGTIRARDDGRWQRI